MNERHSTTLAPRTDLTAFTNATSWPVADWMSPWSFDVEEEHSDVPAMGDWASKPLRH